MDGSIIFDFSSKIVENSILSFGVAISLIAFFSCAVLSNFSVKEMFFSCLFISIFGTIFGSIAHYVFYYNDYRIIEEHMPYYFKVCNLAFFKDNTIGFSEDAWMSDHGLIIGIIIGCLFSSFMFKINFLKLLDCTISSICLLLCSFRLLDLLKVRNFGVPTEKSYGIIFPKIDYLPRHATMMYEFILLLITFFVILYIIKKFDFNINCQSRYGFLFFLGLFFIYMSKVIVGLLKVQDNILTNPVSDFFKLGVDQFLAISFLMLSLIFVIYKFPKVED